jgi:hypothetical protein
MTRRTRSRSSSGSSSSLSTRLINRTYPFSRFVSLGRSRLQSVIIDISGSQPFGNFIGVEPANPA